MPDNKKIVFRGMTVEQGLQHMLARLNDMDIAHVIKSRQNPVNQWMTYYALLADRVDSLAIMPFAGEESQDDIEEHWKFCTAIAKAFDEYIEQKASTKS